MKIYNIFSSANQWFYETPGRALDQAYRSALKIKDIEDKHFKSQKVSLENGKYSSRIIKYFQDEVNNCLQVIRVRITEFNWSRNVLNITNISSSRRYGRGRDVVVLSDSQASLIVKKLEFIESITTKYSKVPSSIEKENNTEEIESMKNPRLPESNNKSNANPSGKVAKTNVIPRTFLSTLDRLKKEIGAESAQTEEEMIRDFRESRYQTSISVRFILILVIVPLFVYQISKTFIIMPAIDRYFGERDRVTFINPDLQKEALAELREYGEMMEFQIMIGGKEPITTEERDKRLKEKAEEISAEYQNRSINAIGNIFADLLSFISITLVVLANKRELYIVKKFLSQLFYNLSDSAKAFMLILFTDMFVGFHSPHGWEVILKGVFGHFGLAENSDFFGVFIATFPVILDTVFKYWIFRYLNGLSPSSVATYKNMNE